MATNIKRPIFSRLSCVKYSRKVREYRSLIKSIYYFS